MALCILGNSLYARRMPRIIVIAHNLRSTHNVGSLLRTAEGLGVDMVYLAGYTPYPFHKDDTRLPYIAEKIDKAIHKTALGAENSIKWQAAEDVLETITKLTSEGYTIIALEQTAKAVPLHKYHSSGPIALVIGNEVTGLPKEILDSIPIHIQIPMSGKKESFNVVQAAAMALFQLSFH